MLQPVALSLLAAAGATSLRWRSATYVVGGNTKAVYGGINTKEIFAANGFTGPAGDADDDWDVLWTHRSQMTALAKRRDIEYRLGRFANHCNYFHAAGNKAILVDHMAAALRNSMRTLHSDVRRLEQFRIDSAAGLARWAGAIRELGKNQHWLIKPSTAGHSQGIEILDFNHASQKAASLPLQAVAQEYLEDGLLLENRKFHVRLYVFVPRWSPLSVYVFDDGVVFHSRHRYKRTRSTKEDVFSGVSSDVEVRALREVLHEVAAAGEGAMACRADAAGRGEGCAASDVQELWRRLLLLIEEAFGNQRVLEANFGDARKTIPSKTGRQYGCFDLFGADVMFDQSLRPALLEINLGPNLWIDGEGADNIPRQRSIKGPLVEQIVRWLKGVVGKQPLSEDDAELLEATVLPNFTRVL